LTISSIWGIVPPPLTFSQASRLAFRYGFP
jgi:hypothetical protein